MRLLEIAFRSGDLMRKKILFVDGYNMIGSWPHLNQLKHKDLIQQARDLLLFELSNYRKFRGIDQLVVVFDAQFVPGLSQSFEEYELTVVFTKEGETADTYIEREVQAFIHPLNADCVATSDAAEQWLIFQQGALRMSAQELLLDKELTEKQIQTEVRHHYQQIVRRRSPWEMEDLEYLDLLRHNIEHLSDKDGHSPK